MKNIKSSALLLICIIFSIAMPNAVLAQTMNKTFVVKDAKLLAKISRSYVKYGYEIEPYFNKQGTKVAYIVKQGYKKAFVGAKGKKGPSYRYINNLNFTSDGKSYVYIAQTKDNSKGFVFVDGKLVKKLIEYPGFGAFLIGGQLIRLAQHNLVIGDYNRQSIPDHPFATRMVISPDEKRVAYVADSAGNYVAVTTKVEE